MARIAVISDLHVGKAARSPELNPRAPAPAPPSDGFLDSFDRFVQNNNIKANILLVPGDISNEAHPAEYRCATLVIQRVAASLGILNESIFPVLGNHDLNWSLINAIEDAGEFCRTLRFSPVNETAWLRQRLTSGSGQSQTDVPYLSIDETPNFFIVRYNSAENDLPHQNPHRGAIQQVHLDALRDLLEANTPHPSKIKVFLTHHHPKIYSDPIPDLPDFSALVNAEALLELLRANNFDLIVHGHKHSPRFSSSVEAGAGALSILCAGSFSRSIESAWVGKITNQFHIIDCIGRDSTTGHLRGEVLSWAYRPRSWIPSSRDWSGISHRIRFGAYPSEAELRSTLKSAIDGIVGDRYVTWADLLRAEPRLEFVDSMLVSRVLRVIADESGLILLFDPDEPQKLTVVRR